MGVLTAIRKQDDPDGLAGHEERQAMQDENRNFPGKQKFTEGRSVHVYTVPIITKKMQHRLDIENMQLKCDIYKSGCQIVNCPTCKRKREHEGNQKKKWYNDMRNEVKRYDYWQSKIAFECPIRKEIHRIDTCFKTCEQWGRTYQDDGNGRSIAILHCYADPEGERELQSGKPTKGLI